MQLAHQQFFAPKNPTELKDHPLNKKIYGKPEVDDDFVESVREHGLTEHIHVLPDDTILSGHRRRAAAVKAGLDKIIVCVRPHLESDEDAERFLILANRHRVKTEDVLAKEAYHLKVLYGENASVDQKQALKKGTEKQESPVVPKMNTTGKRKEKSKTHEKVASDLGTSGTKARKLADLGEHIAKARERGDTEEAIRVEKKIVQESVHAAHQDIKPPPHKEQPDEVTQQFLELESLLNKAYSARIKLIKSIDGLAFNSTLHKKAHEAILSVDSTFFKSLTTCKTDFASLQSTWVTHKPVPPKPEEDPFGRPAEPVSFEEEASEPNQETPPF